MADRPTVIRHADRFRALGDGPLVTFGIHAHGKRIVPYEDGG
jgi:hypothetical protein